MQTWIGVTLTTLLLGLALPGQATVWYSWLDAPCPGTGTATAPFCTLAAGFKALQCGDELRVGASATPYSEQVVVNGPACTPELPIVVTFNGVGGTQEAVWSAPASPGNDLAVLTLTDVSHWHLRGLVMQGHAQGTKYGVLVQAVTRSVVGFTMWGGRLEGWNLDRQYPGSVGIGLMGNRATSASVVSPRLQHVLVDGFRGTGFSLQQTVQGLFQDLEVRNGLCTPANPWEGKGGRLTGVSVGGYDSSSVAQSYGNTFQRVRIHDLQDDTGCKADTGNGWVLVHGLYCDVYSSDGLLTDSDIWNIGNSGLHRATGIGVRLESRCHRWTVRDVRITGTGNNGLQLNAVQFDTVIERVAVRQAGSYCFALYGSGTASTPSLRRVVRQSSCVDAGTGNLWLDTTTSWGDVIEGNSWQVTP